MKNAFPAKAQNASEFVVFERSRQQDLSTRRLLVFASFFSVSFWSTFGLILYNLKTKLTSKDCRTLGHGRAKITHFFSHQTSKSGHRTSVLGRFVQGNFFTNFFSDFSLCGDVVEIEAVSEKPTLEIAAGIPLYHNPEKKHVVDGHTKSSGEKEFVDGAHYSNVLGGILQVAGARPRTLFALLLVLGFSAFGKKGFVDRATI